MTRLSPFLLTLLVVPLALVLMTGCEETPTSCPTYEIGTLQGYVTSLGQGVPARVQAETINGESDFRYRFETESDSTGWYQIDLPSGRYTVTTNSRDRFPLFSGQGDTVRISNQVQRYDIEHGQVEVEITLPGDIKDKYFNLSLEGERRKTGSLERDLTESGIRFYAPLMKPGVYRLLLSSNGADNFYLPGTMDREEAATITVGTEEITRLEFDLSSSLVSIGGTITSCGTQSSRGLMQVRVHRTEQKVLAHDYVHADESFFCEFFLPGPVRLKTEHDGLTQWVGGDSFDTAQVFDLQPGAPVSDIWVERSGLTVHLEGPGALVRHKPYIIIRPESGQDMTPYISGESSFSLCNLRPGRYFLFIGNRCFEEVWAPQWYGGSETFAGAQPIDLAEGEVHEITLNLLEGGRIEGGFVSPDGAPYPKVSYRLIGLEQENPCDYYLTSEDGHMGFKGLADGTYRLTANFPDYSHWYYPGTWYQTEAELITIVDHELVTITDWALPSVLGGSTP